MIELTPVRTLTLTAPSSPGRPAHLSAASGLVEVGEYLYVVADDELQLGAFPVAGDAPGTLVELFAGELPASHHKRKARKPDLEVLVHLPRFAHHADGALLALGSGSTPLRNTGALLSLDPQGRVTGTSQSIDLTGIYDLLRTRFESVNIEGAAALADELVLLQRGNKHIGNAIIRLRLTDVMAALATANSLGTVPPIGVRPYDLGAVDGVPLCFTDGAALPDGSLIFTAVAEDSDNSYSDGPCVGAAIGITNAEGRLRFLERVDRRHKIEGIDARVDGSLIRLRLVTDDDDETRPAWLLSAEIRGYPFR